MKSFEQLFKQSSDSYPLNIPVGALPEFAISGREQAEGSVLQITNGIAVWEELDINDIIGDDPIDAEHGGTGLSSYTTGDIIVAYAPDTLGVIHAPVANKAFFSTGLGTVPAYRRITAADVDAGTFPGALYTFTADVVIGGKLSFTTAASRIVAGGTSIAFRNNANTFNNILVADAGVVTFRNNLTWTADNSFDVGESTFRIKELYVITIDSGASDLTLQRNNVSAITVGVSNISVGAFNLIWTSDNSKDIGASGATRPRTAYIGTSVIVGSFGADVGVTMGTSTTSFGGNVIIDSATAKITINGTDGTVAAGSVGLMENGASLYASSGGSVVVLVDNDNDSSVKTFSVYNNVTTASGTPMFRVSEDGNSQFATNIIFSADNTYDVGTSILRIKELFVITIDSGASDLIIQRNNVTALTFGASAISIGGFNLIWTTDNTSDIGASAATRPRSIYVGTSIVIGTDPTGSNELRIGGTLITRSTSATSSFERNTTTTNYGLELYNLDTTVATLHETGVKIRFKDTAGTALLAGAMYWKKEQEWTSTGSTRDDLWALQVAVNGTLQHRLVIFSSGGVRFFGSSSTPPVSITDPGAAIASTVDNTNDIGTSTERWRTGYFGTSVIIKNDPSTINAAYSGTLRGGTTNSSFFRFTDGQGFGSSVAVSVFHNQSNWAVPVSPINGDTIGDFNFKALASGLQTGALIRGVASQDWSSGYGTIIQFQTVLSGFAGTANRHIIDSSGHLIGGADNTYDLGLVATRYRALYSTNAYHNETGGTQLKLFGAVSDGQYLKRSGTDIIGDTLTVDDVDGAYPSALGYAGI